MSARQRLRSAWLTALEYNPIHVSRRRIYVGRLVIVTRTELQRTAREYLAAGERQGVQQVLDLVRDADLVPRGASER